MTPDEFKTIEAKGFVRQPDGSYIKIKPDRLASPAKQESNPVHESVAAPPRAVKNTSRCRVCVTSFRCRLLDERNIWEHYAVDALTKFGVIFDDSTKWVEIKVQQVHIDNPVRERTVITVETIPESVP